MESQRERTPHVTDTPRCRLSLNDLEQLNAARSESFQPEKLHSPRLSSVSAPVLTPRHAHTLGAANPHRSWNLLLPTTNTTVPACSQ